MDQSVDLSKLKGILMKSKNVMKAVDGNNYQKGNITEDMLSEGGMARAKENGYAPEMTPEMQRKSIENSKLPQAIKEMMIANPIDTTAPTFTLDEMGDLVEKPYVPSQRPRTVTENTHQNVNSDYITISKTELRGMIDEALLEFMTKAFTQNLSETVIKKTITTLVREGKINLTKKPAEKK